MSDFRTNIVVPPSAFRIDHQNRVLLAGSCFTAHIGQRLLASKFWVLINPFGTIYNPVSLAKSVLPDTAFLPTPFFEQAGLWRHWDLHSDLAATDLPTAVEQAQKAAHHTHQFLSTTDVLVLTLGSADVFCLQETQQIVANCHKMPARIFEQKRLTVAHTVATLSKLVQDIRVERPNLKVILTVSPVRHWRNGAVENQRSKAVLLLACAELTEILTNVAYFPAYEILLDDLRDYRFYADDMLHPSETAIDYIWNKFAETYFTPATQQLCRQIEKVTTAARHRPFNPETEQHRAFQQQQLEAIKSLETAHPEIRMDEEKRIFGG